MGSDYFLFTINIWSRVYLSSNINLQFIEIAIKIYCMWFPFALISALIIGGKRVYEKHLTNTFGNFAMGFLSNAFSLLPTLLLVFILPHGTDIQSVSWRFWWPLLVIWFGLYPIQTYLLYRAIREGDVSTVTPVFALLPVFNIGTSFILLGEKPTIIGWVAILLIVFGTYLMLRQETTAKKTMLPVLMMIGSVFCIALGSTLDKIAIGVSNPVFYSFVNTLGASVIFFILMHFYKERESFIEMRIHFWVLTLLGVLSAISFTTLMYAFQYGPTSYVLAVRALGYVMAGLYGVFVLREVLSIRKIFSLICFLTGIIVLAFA